MTYKATISKTVQMFVVEGDGVARGQGWRELTPIPLLINNFEASVTSSPCHMSKDLSQLNSHVVYQMKGV
jgi:hypothetical protein